MRLLSSIDDCSVLIMRRVSTICPSCCCCCLIIVQRFFFCFSDFMICSRSHFHCEPHFREACAHGNTVNFLFSCTKRAKPQNISHHCDKWWDKLEACLARALSHIPLSIEFVALLSCCLWFEACVWVAISILLLLFFFLTNFIVCIRVTKVFHTCMQVCDRHTIWSSNVVKYVKHQILLLVTRPTQ